MKHVYSAILGLTFLAFFSNTHGAVVYNSLPAANTQDGAIWGGGAFGDAITLSGNSAVLDGLAFRASPIFSSGNYLFTAFFYEIGAGADGIYQTGDETVGNLLGVSSGQSFNLVSGNNTEVALTGFSVAVPKNFLWVVANANSNDIVVSAIIGAANYASVVGGTSSTSSGFWDNNGLPAAGSGLTFLGFSGSHPYDEDWAVQLNGVVSGVPEPSALSLLAVGLGGLAMIRRRRS